LCGKKDIPSKLKNLVCTFWNNNTKEYIYDIIAYECALRIMFKKKNKWCKDKKQMQIYTWDIYANLGLQGVVHISEWQGLFQ